MKWSYVVLLAGAVAMAGCSQRGYNQAIQTTPKFVEGVNFQNYKTWKFAREDQYPVTGNVLLDDPAFRRDAGKHMITEMQSLGYEHVTAEPDFLMMLHIVFENKFDEQKLDDLEKGYDLSWAQFGEDDAWRQGSMALIAIDAKTGQQIWGSLATARLYEPASDRDEALRRMNTAITRLLDDFPIRTP